MTTLHLNRKLTGRSPLRCGFLLIPLVLACSALSPLVNASITYDFETDFSATSNPNGTWSYGWSTSRGTPFNLYPVELVIAGGFDVWRVSPGTDTPAVGVNMTNVTITPACCDPIPPGSSNVHPGPGGENAIVRWTAPTGGTYQVFASFSGGDMAGTTTDVAVLKNSSTSLYIAEVTGFGPSSAQTFSGNVTVVAGDTLDFTVGFGTDQNYYSDGTYLTVIIKTLVNAQVQQPINADGTSVFSVRHGVVPVKFTLMDNGIATCTLPPATIAVTRTAGGTTGQIDESVYTLSADTGSNFRIDSCQYVYNLSASALGGGTYRVDIQINGQVVGSGIFQLK